jgi:hypothetical protein
MENIYRTNPIAYRWAMEEEERKQNALSPLPVTLNGTPIPANAKADKMDAYTMMVWDVQLTPNGFKVVQNQDEEGNTYPLLQSMDHRKVNKANRTHCSSKHPLQR